MGEIWTATFVLGGVFGASILIAGVFLGLMIGRLRRGTHSAAPNDRVLNYLGGLMNWTSGFVAELEDYRCEVAELTGRIDGAGRSVVPATDMDAIRQFVRANETLQKRLGDAEEQLREQAEEMVAYVAEARTDALTGLPNRRVFDNELTRRMSDFRRRAISFGLVMLDVDHFKQCNDRYGHPAGDAVLQRVGESLRSCLPGSPTVCRFGGEEFAVILPQAGAADVSRAAEMIRGTIEESAVAFEGRTLRVTVSCGAAVVQQGDTPDTLVQRCDNALYAAKDGGRNRVMLHNGVRCAEPIAERLAQVVDDETDRMAFHRESGGAFSLEGGPSKDEAPEEASLREAKETLRNRLREFNAGPERALRERDA